MCGSGRMRPKNTETVMQSSKMSWQKKNGLRKCACRTHTGTIHRAEKQFLHSLQRVQISHQVLHFLLINLVGEPRHHSAPAENTLHHMIIGGSESAGEIL